MNQEQRPAIPTALKRKIYVESGHRCAIPTCRQTPVELAHIVAWSKCREHTFDNLIALCPTCHTRFDRGDIDLNSMRNYKHNLGVLNSRYGDFEQRVLHAFAKESHSSEIWLPGGLDIMLMYLLEDGLLEDTGRDSGVILNDMPSQKLYSLTQKGREFIDKWISSDEIP
jgi:hypothetical protein